MNISWIIKEEIDKEYSKTPSKRYDVLNNKTKEKKDNDFLSFLIVLICVGGVVSAIVIARNSAKKAQ